MSDGRANAPGAPRPEPFVERRAVEIPELLVRAPDAVMLLDAQATVLDVNEEACRSLGYAREELLAGGCNLDWKNPRGKEDITHRPPEALVQDILAKERRIVDIMSEIATMLEKGKDGGRDHDG